MAGNKPRRVYQFHADKYWTLMTIRPLVRARRRRVAQQIRWARQRTARR